MFKPWYATDMALHSPGCTGSPPSSKHLVSPSIQLVWVLEQGSDHVFVACRVPGMALQKARRARNSSELAAAPVAAAAVRPGLRGRPSAQLCPARPLVGASQACRCIKEVSAAARTQAGGSCCMPCLNASELRLLLEILVPSYSVFALLKH